jgi:hypothetical protein
MTARTIYYYDSYYYDDLHYDDSYYGDYYDVSYYYELLLRTTSSMNYYYECIHTPVQATRLRTWFMRGCVYVCVCV